MFSVVFLRFFLRFQSSSTYASTCHHQTFTPSIRLCVLTGNTSPVFFSVFNLYEKIQVRYMFRSLVFFLFFFFDFFFFNYLPFIIVSTTTISVWLSGLALALIHVYLGIAFEIRLTYVCTKRHHHAVCHIFGGLYITFLSLSLSH